MLITMRFQVPRVNLRSSLDGISTQAQDPTNSSAKPLRHEGHVRCAIPVGNLLEFAVLFYQNPLHRENTYHR